MGRPPEGAASLEYVRSHLNTPLAPGKFVFCGFFVTCLLLCAWVSPYTTRTNRTLDTIAI